MSAWFDDTGDDSRCLGPGIREVSVALDLPALTPDEAEHSARLAERVRAEIARAGGWISFARYMELALYAPGLGYYSAGAAKFGPAGDFVTAPELSPLFARCLARACAPYLRASGDRTILEIGPGSGALAAGLLEALAGLGAAPAGYHLLEVSADLRGRQQATLRQRAPAHLERVRWLEELPEAVNGIVIANEVADALPVSRFTRSVAGVTEQGVTATPAGFAWSARPAGADLARAVADVEASLGRRLAEGYTSEVSLQLPGWVEAVGRTLQAGLFLLCDYGMSRREYYHPQRDHGTLTCHYRHRAHADPFFHPGLQDITAWVDFTAVATAADACRLDVLGYTTQAHFLLDAGLETELATAGGSDLRLLQQAKTLLLPGEMGERFKVMALARGPVEMPGFGIRDLRHLL